MEVVLSRPKSGGANKYHMNIYAVQIIYDRCNIKELCIDDY